ncbi:MAG: transglycosylase SLT domain-containing protein [Bacteriovoracaceae bacterium]|nr:transglycosylase SLT domain-containing protein [Bacteriovoracaceae bacterium]
MFYFSVATASPNLNFSSTAMASDIPFKLNYSQNDYEYGKLLISFYSELQNSEFVPSTYKKIIALKNKDHSFKQLLPIIERIELIAAIKDSQDNFHTNCAIVAKPVNEFTDNLLQRMDIALDRLCRSIFLNKLQKISATATIEDRDLNYFKEASDFFVSGEGQTDLNSVLGALKKNKKEHEKLSNMLIAKFVELQTKPTSAILQNLHINLTLNLFLQNNLHLDSNSILYFQEEFNKNLKLSQELVEKGEYIQAKQQVISALNFYSKNKKFIDENIAWVRTTNTAKSFYYKGRDLDAVEIFALARTIAPKTESSEANFYLLWPHLINKDFKSMKSVVSNYNLEKNFDTYDSKLQYWIAYSFYKNGEVKKANSYFNKIITTSPYSFYSIISLKELAAQNKNLSEEEILSKIISKNSPVEIKIDTASDSLKDALKRLAVWNELGHEKFATLEVRHIQSMDKSTALKDIALQKSILDPEFKEFIVLNLVRLLHSQEKYISSFKIFQESLGENSLSLNYRLIKYIFPLSYIKLIEKNSNNLDPLMVISLIRQESAFNPEATSRVGAKGLMQLMPATAKRFNKKLKVKHLSNPEVNISIGTQYLKQLLERFDGNLIYTLASYNAGENRIDRWKKEIFRNDDPMATIEAIPFEETRSYVKLIYRNKFFYSLLLNKPTLNKSIEDTFKVTSIDFK